MKHYATIEPANWPCARTTPVRPLKSDSEITRRELWLIRAAWAAGLTLCLVFWGAVAAILLA